MSTVEEDYAREWQADLYMAELDRDRNQQTHDRILGVSDIMHCRSYAARFLNGDPFTDSSTHKAATLGTMVHDAVLPLIAEARGARHNVELSITLPNKFKLTGHADLIDGPDVIDLKTTRGLAGARRYGASPQQKMQRNLYAAGVVQDPSFDVAASEAVTGNIWMDVDDLDALPHVELEPYDPSYLDTAQNWLDEVMYHVDNGLVQDAPRDKDVFWCRQFCPFVTACRGSEAAAVDEVIESDELAIAAALRREAIELEKESKELRKASDEVLARVQDAKVLIRGGAGTFRVASTWVRETDVAYTRSGYYKTDVKEIK